MAETFEDIFADLDSRAPTEAQEVVKILLRLGSQHWQHDHQAVQGGSRTKWLDVALETLSLMHQGKYHLKFSRDYLIQVPGHAEFKQPMSWELISALTAKALFVMFRMPDYSCGSIFYPDRLDRWLLSDNKGSKTSCFLRMLSMETRAPAWTLADLANAPSKERALISRVMNALPEVEVRKISRMYRNLDNPIQEHTFWGRVGIVASWLGFPDTQATRDQFGPQENRKEPMRHGFKWDAVADLPSLVRRLMEFNGAWRGWFPVPGEREWATFLEHVVMETGVYLYPVASTASSPASTRRPALSGSLPTTNESREIYLADIQS